MTEKNLGAEAIVREGEAAFARWRDLVEELRPFGLRLEIGGRVFVQDAAFMRKARPRY